MTTPSAQVVVLRNEGVASKRAQYAEGELQARLDLELVPQHARAVIEHFITVVKSISFGQDEKVVQKTIDDLIETLVDMSEAAQTLSSEKVAAAIELLNKKRDEVVRVQEPLLNERDAKVKKLATVELSLKHLSDTDGAFALEKTTLSAALASLRGHIATLTDKVTDIDGKTRRLVAYRNATQTVRAGLPEELFKD